MANTILQTCWRTPGRKLDRKKVTARELAESKWKADYLLSYVCLCPESVKGINRQMDEIIFPM